MNAAEQTKLTYAIGTAFVAPMAAGGGLALAPATLGGVALVGGAEGGVVGTLIDGAAGRKITPGSVAGNIVIGSLGGVVGYGTVKYIAAPIASKIIARFSPAADSEALSSLSAPKFWKAPETIGSDKVGFRRVYQRDDLFESTDANIARMASGKAPIGFDGEPVNLHHLIQSESGPLAEVGGKFHSENTGVLHGLVEPKSSFRYTPDGSTSAAEKAFNRYKYWYWQQRAKGF